MKVKVAATQNRMPDAKADSSPASGSIDVNLLEQACEALGIAKASDLIAMYLKAAPEFDDEPLGEKWQAMKDSQFVHRGSCFGAANLDPHNAVQAEAGSSTFCLAGRNELYMGEASLTGFSQESYLPFSVNVAQRQGAEDIMNDVAIPEASHALTLVNVDTSSVPRLQSGFMDPSKVSNHTRQNGTGMIQQNRQQGKELQSSRKTTKNTTIQISQSTSHTSKFRGVSKHRWTKKWEAHLWDADAARSRMGPGARKRGKQVYLGAYNTEEAAAHAYDKAAIVYWGIDSASLNFSKETYFPELSTLLQSGRDEIVHELRRRSSGFSRGVSKYRGVTKHHQQGRWEARIGRHNESKYQYLGTFPTEEEAARAYDYAALKTRGLETLTNHPAKNYMNPKTKALRQIPELDLVLNGRISGGAEQTHSRSLNSTISVSNISNTAAPTASDDDFIDLSLSTQSADPPLEASMENMAHSGLVMAHMGGHFSESALPQRDPSSPYLAMDNVNKMDADNLGDFSDLGDIAKLP